MILHEKFRLSWGIGNTFPPYLAGFTRVLSTSFESRPYDHKALRSAFFLVNRGRDGVGDFTMPVYFQRPENALKRANGKKESMSHRGGFSINSNFFRKLKKVFERNLLVHKNFPFSRPIQFLSKRLLDLKLTPFDFFLVYLLL